MHAAAQNNAAPLECTALIDQRDWGGCVDITLNAAGVPGAEPPPAPIIPNAASYRMLATNSIDTSAADFVLPARRGRARDRRRRPGAQLVGAICAQFCAIFAPFLLYRARR